MTNIRAKILGSIATLLGVKIFLDMAAGNAASGLAGLAGLLSLPPEAAMIGSFFLGVLGVGFGLRALIWNRVCIGDQCPIEEPR